ncbi:hypothetical protein B0I72DRAFT_133211 [Yarrowia lipolytica]|jgi:DNA mismatch repair ATPase MutL|uniref:YALI0E06105p n=2 Tax=Yarrowia lipolytica TaxID=4952 RepID=Q6C6U7_YARLI|nr:YALI0E06105p [Yarrowia lipolytica CLIB122]AOW05027.1 hypothetical protein YALI1_E07409g [Yarrowia lipolytica]KAB8286160.1 hypothetical protein BKA91DRAFT_91798 [Yarrowia lipolytica]KAE8171424.1 hypothetical protein BKA90DRAFT_99899 [Yarrowia lipolytica]KAJ8056591.1 hypothetical protein LXG23DRAFT_16250 [Yarrowia lipolytica]RDW27829.1 hypothetical protein B0I71DRAFT_93692 [Yarrowia lipolytica]|eukprot:XP_503615.1 YALI0E06105p [Yarrowia lipolytica CLIB122]
MNNNSRIMVPMHSLPSPGQPQGPTSHHMGYQYVETPPSPKSRKSSSFNPKYMPPLDSSYRLGYKPLFKRENEDPFKYDISSPTPAQSPYDERKTSAPSVVTSSTTGYPNYTTEPLPRKRGYSAPQNKAMVSMVHHMQPQQTYHSSSSSSNSSRATIKKARRAYRSKFTQEQDRLIISMKNENKTWQEIKEMVKGETPHNIQRRYEVLMAQMNGNLIWEQDDLDALVDLLEAAERHKWKHISSELSRKLDKKVTPLACQKKFKEMFGVAENSSLLGSSLCYAYYDNGWNCVE